MEALENHLELFVQDEDSDEGSESGNEMGGSNNYDSDGSTVEGERVVQAGRAGEPREPVAEEDEGGGNVTSDSEGELGEDNMAGRGDAREPLQIGETVSVNDLIWERIESLAQDARREEEMQSKFTRLHISDATKEVDVFLQLMPLSKEKLLQIVRDGAAVAKDKRKWEIEHIEAALCIIFGGAQYKAGTNLWGVQKKDMLRAPDFGLHLSEDRFGKILRYW